MTAPLRQPLNSFVGTIAPCVATAQTMTAAVFTTLPTYLSASLYVPAEVIDETTGAHEMVRIIGADGSATATVIRGVEGTSPLTWSQPATIRCGPALYDLLQVVPRLGDIPTDLHVGARVMAGEDEALVREQTQRQGAQPAARAGSADMPTTLAGLYQHLPGESMRLKAIQFGPITTGASGEMRVMWDDGAVLVNQQKTVTDGPSLRYVSFLGARGYLAGSDASWAGDIVVHIALGPPWWAQLIAYWPKSSTPFAYRQISGSLLVAGA